MIMRLLSIADCLPSLKGTVDDTARSVHGLGQPLLSGTAPAKTLLSKHCQ